MPQEINCYLKWLKEPQSALIQTEIVQEKDSELCVRDGDSDVIFDSERLPLTASEYLRLKNLCLKSARDFERLYNLIPDKNKSALDKRSTFYGEVPVTATEMYEHTKNVNGYYFGEIGVDVDNDGTIFDCRAKGFAELEKIPEYLNSKVVEGSYDELWSLRKVLRRFIWHDRIHAKAMFRMAMKTFDCKIENVFEFRDA